MSTSIDKEYAKQLELTKWIDERFKIRLPADRRSLLSITCFDLAIEHHTAICILCNAQLYGSMFALLRILVESYVRGLWLSYCASALEIDLYVEDKHKVEFGTMITSIESSLNIESGPLSSMKSSTWKLLNSFTHSGFQHLLRRNADGTTGNVNYATSEICSALNFAGSFSLLSAVGLASFTGNRELSAEVLIKVEEYNNTKGIAE